jgi:hypothetical protein
MGNKWAMMQDDACVLHITMFGRKGELQTMNHINNSYTVSKHAPRFSPTAFWMQELALGLIITSV